MKITDKDKILKSSIGILIAIFLFFSSGLRFPVLDTTSDLYFQEAIRMAGVAYATCRVINASVSIIKESTLQLEPAGVGMSLAVGQVLDPIDDMTERLSDVLVTAITSLGVQKLAYLISVSLAPPVFSIFLFILSVIVWFNNDRLKSFQKTIMRFALLIIIARFCLPISSLANEFLHKHFFANQISDARKELESGSIELDKLKEFSFPEVDGVLGTIENSTLFLKRKSIEFKNAFVVTVTNMGSIVENLLKLTFLYVAIFMIQVILLPLAVFWLLVKTANALFFTNIPVILNSRSSQDENL